MKTADIRRIAQLLRALGDPTRLQIFSMLCCCNSPLAVKDSGQVRPVCGQTAGEICCQVTGQGRINSRISFHLKELRQAGLISVERQGKHMICAIKPDTLSEIKSVFEQMAAKMISKKRGRSCKMKQSKCNQ
jgi:ArsR family transcriptional regulator, arsenate/arsenite/antimonite-responsive transcriptional repressor